MLIDAGDYDIACCFTSERYGRGRDPEAKILESTRRAFEDMVGQLKQRGEVPSVAACKLNAGKFGVRPRTCSASSQLTRDARVDWAKTKAILTEVFDKAGIDVTVYDR